MKKPDYGMIVMFLVIMLILTVLYFAKITDEPVKRDRVWERDSTAIFNAMQDTVNDIYLSSTGDPIYYRPRNSPPDSGLKDFRR